MDIIKLYRDFNIQFQTEGHKHCRPGWVNCECPFCTGNPGLHLGATLDGNHFYCWRCGWKPVNVALAKLLKVAEYKIPEIIILYGGVSRVYQKQVEKKQFSFPTNTMPLRKSHRIYLEQRGFDADKIVRDWHILSTSPTSILDKIKYSNRILIPIYWNGNPVSFQTRTTSPGVDLRYIACPQGREIYEHKTILYGNQVMWGGTGICVEGVTDVWRFGYYAFGTFGIEYTRQQVRLMAKSFKRIVVIYDDDPQAIIKADELVYTLTREFRKDAFRVGIMGDPGSLPQSDADYLIKQLI